MSASYKYDFALCLELARGNDPDFKEVSLPCDTGQETTGLKDDDIDRLCEALEDNLYVKSLVLWGNQRITAKGGAALFKLLKTNRTIERVNLDLTEVPEEDRVRLGRELLARRIGTLDPANPELEHVTSLDLSRSDVLNMDLEKISAGLKDNVSLTSLSLWGNPAITQEGAKHLEALLKNNTTLVSISLSGTGVPKESQDKIARHISTTRLEKAFSRLRLHDRRFPVMNLAGASLDDEKLSELGRLLRKNTVVKSLLLAGNPAITPAGLDALMDSLDSDNPLSPLVHLDADWKRFGDKVKRRIRVWTLRVVGHAVASNSSRAERIDLSGAGYTDQELRSLFEELQHNHTVTSLDLSNNNLTDQTLRPLATLIPRHKTLARLVLRGSGVSSLLHVEIDRLLLLRNLERAKEALAENSPDLVRLTILQDADISDEEILELAPFFEKNTHVAEILLNGSKQLTQHGISSLLESSNNSSLTRLVLRSAPEGGMHPRTRKLVRQSMGKRALAVALAVLGPKGGKHADMHRQGVTDDGVRRLAKALDESVTTVSIDLSGNPGITDAGARTLFDALTKNTTLLRIDLRGSSAGAYRARIEQKLRQRAVAFAKEALLLRCHPPMKRVQAPLDVLARSGLTDEGLAPLLRYVGKGDTIDVLDLSNNPRLSDASGRELLKVLRKVLPQLGDDFAPPHTIRLENTGISAAVIAEIDEECRRIAIQAAAAALRASPDTIVTLSILSHRQVTDTDMDEIAKAVMKNHSVEVLDLRGNPGVTDEAARALERAVESEGYKGRLRKVLFDGTRTGAVAQRQLQQVLDKAQYRLSAHTGGMAVADSEGGWQSFADGMVNGLQRLQLSIGNQITSVDSDKRMVAAEPLALPFPFGSTIDGITLPPPDEILGSAEVGASYLSLLAAPAASAASTPRDSDKRTAPTATIAAPERMTGVQEGGGGVGVRLKLSNPSASLRAESIASMLRVDAKCVEILASSKEPGGTSIQDLKLWQPAVGTQEGRTCDEVAAALYQLCEDRRSRLCVDHNKGREIFCHFPWSVSGGRSSATSPPEARNLTSSERAHNLQGEALKRGTEEALERGGGVAHNLQRAYAHESGELVQELDLRGFHAPRIRAVLDRMCADALEALRPLVFAISLGPNAAPLALSAAPSAPSAINAYKPSNSGDDGPASGLAVLPPVPNPEELRAGRKGVCALCEQFFELVRGRGGRPDRLPDEPRIGPALLAKWDEVKALHARVEAASDRLLTLQPPPWINISAVRSPTSPRKHVQSQVSLPGAEEVSMRRVEEMRTACEGALERARVRREANDFHLERARVFLRGRRDQVKHERRHIEAALKRLERKRDVDMEAIKALLDSIAKDGREMLQLARRDEALAKLEKESEDAILREMQMQSDAMAHEQADWKFGVDLTDSVLASIDTVLKEARKIVKGESEAVGASSEQLSLALFKHQLCPLLSLALLEAGRVQASIDLDEEEVERIKSRTDVYDQVGKESKVQRAQQAWAGGESGGRIGDASIISQHAYLGRVKDMVESIDAESLPVWARMSSLEDTVLICARTTFELIMLVTTDSHGWECIPHPRALARVISFTEMVATPGQFPTLPEYYKHAEQDVKGRCAASPQFRVEYRQALMDVKRAEDLVSRVRGRFLAAKASLERAAKEEKMRSDRERAERAQLEVLEDAHTSLQRLADQGTADLDLAQQELDEAHLAVLRAEVESGKRGRSCTKCGNAVVPEMGELDAEGGQVAAEAALKRWGGIAAHAMRNVWFVKWHAKILEARLRTKDEAANKRRSKVREASEMARSAGEVLRAAGGEFSVLTSSLKEAEKDLRRRQQVASAYGAVASGLQQEDASGRAHLVLRSHVHFRVNVVLVTGDRFHLVGRDEKVRARYCSRVHEGLVKILAVQGDTRSMADLERRLNLAGMSEAPDGVTRVHLFIIEDPGDAVGFVMELLHRLRTQLIPSEQGAVPVLLPTGFGSTGSSKVMVMEVLDPLSRGAIGDVREADVGARRVAVKEIRLHGVSGHLARERMRTVEDELVRGVSALCMLAHPNIHPYMGICVYQAESGPPFCALVQDFCYSTLDRFLGRHNAPHSPSVTLPLRKLHEIAKALDSRGAGRISQAKFLQGIEREPWIADALKLPKRVRDRWAARNAAREAAEKERKRLGGNAVEDAPKDAKERAEQAEADECLEFIWCYGGNSGSFEAPRMAHHHEFGRIDRDASRTIDLEKLAIYFGPRDLPDVRIAWAQRIQLALAITRGMQYLAACGIAHGNLKSANVAVVSHATPASGAWTLDKVAVMDFGIPHLSKGLSIPLETDFGASSAAWSAPELLLAPSTRGQGVELASQAPAGSVPGESGGTAAMRRDVWSLGVLLWEIMVGNVPWLGKSREHLRALAARGELQLPLHLSATESAPAGFVDAVTACMHQEPGQRPTFTKVIELLTSRDREWPDAYLPG